VDFDITPRLRNFKGYGLNGPDRQAKTMHLYIRTISKESNLVFDRGSGLMAHASRSGAFGAATVSDIWSRKDAKVGVDQAFLNCPIFMSIAARGFGLDQASSLRWSAAAKAFRDLCDEAGFRGEYIMCDSR
jgi:hypothetical protein